MCCRQGVRIRQRRSERCTALALCEPMCCGRRAAGLGCGLAGRRGHGADRDAPGLHAGPFFEEQGGHQGAAARRHERELENWGKALGRSQRPQPNACTLTARRGAHAAAHGDACTRADRPLRPDGRRRRGESGRLLLTAQKRARWQPAVVVGVAPGAEAAGFSVRSPARDKGSNASDTATRLPSRLSGQPASQGIPLRRPPLSASGRTAPQAYHLETLQALREAMEETNTLCAVMLNPAGPDLRVLNR